MPGGARRAAGQADLQPVPRRAAPRRAGLDVSGLDGVIAIDVRRRDVAEVQGMCTYEHLVEVTLAARPDPARGPAAAHHHPRRCGHRARHRVDQLPQRAAARVGARDGRADRRRRVVTTRPGDDLFDAFPNSYGSLGYATRLRIELERVPAVRRAAARALRRPGLLPEAIGDDRRHRRVGRRARRRPRRRGLRAGEAYLTLARWTDEPGADQRLHAARRSSTGRSSSARPTG